MSEPSIAPLPTGLRVPCSLTIMRELRDDGEVRELRDGNDAAAMLEWTANISIPICTDHANRIFEGGLDAVPGLRDAYDETARR